MSRRQDPAAAKLGKTRLEPIFSTPLFHFAVDDHAALNDALLAEIAVRRASEPDVDQDRSSHQGGWHSRYDLFLRREPAHVALAGLFRNAFLAATREVTPDNDFSAVKTMVNGWINANPPGAFNRPHDHGEWFWSAVYYIRCPDDAAETPADAGAIEFIDGRSSGARRPPFAVPFLRRKHLVQPHEGQLILFPASLLHWVYPTMGQGVRVTAAANMRFEARASQRLAPQPVAPQPGGAGATGIAAVPPRLRR